MPFQIRRDKDSAIEILKDGFKRAFEEMSKAIIKATEAKDVDQAKKVATPDQKAEAAKAATLARTVTDFDEDGHGGYIPTIKNPETGREVTARAVVKSVIVPSN